MAERQNTRREPVDARDLLIDGVDWRVYELTVAYDRRQKPSLVFESKESMRRVRDYPSNWRELTDRELYAVSWGV